MRVEPEDHLAAAGPDCLDHPGRVGEAGRVEVMACAPQRPLGSTGERHGSERWKVRFVRTVAVSGALLEQKGRLSLRAGLSAEALGNHCMPKDSAFPCGTTRPEHQGCSRSLSTCRDFVIL